MGRQKSIIRQVTERLHGMAAYGRSKHADKMANKARGLGSIPDRDKIYSIRTMEDYHRAACGFAEWARSEHGCRTLEAARPYAAEYLQGRIGAKLSAWTVHQDAAAIAKLYQCPMKDLQVDLPARHRGDVVKHFDREPKGFSYAKNADLAALGRACGLRRCELQELRPSDVRTDAKGRTIVHVRQGKGGKERDAIALNDAPKRLADAAAAAGRDRVIEHVPGRAPTHAWRRDYATEVYHQLAWDHPTTVYKCQADLSGKDYDAVALGKAAEALGHSTFRHETATHYVDK